MFSPLSPPVIFLVPLHIVRGVKERDKEGRDVLCTGGTVWINGRSVASVAKDSILRYSAQSHWVFWKNQQKSAIAHISPASLSWVSLLQFSLQISFSTYFHPLFPFTFLSILLKLLSVVLLSLAVTLHIFLSLCLSQPGWAVCQWIT